MSNGQTLGRGGERALGGERADMQFVEDELREVIGDSLHTIYDSITAEVAKPFGTHAVVVKGKDPLPARGLIVHMRRLYDWTLEYEVYRRSNVRR